MSRWREVAASAAVLQKAWSIREKNVRYALYVGKKAGDIKFITVPRGKSDSEACHDHLKQEREKRSARRRRTI